MPEIKRGWIKESQEENQDPISSPERLLNPENINTSLNAMLREAVIELELRKGVAFLAYWKLSDFEPTVGFRVVHTISRDPDPKREGDIGTNYFGIAMGKLAYMFAATTDSGTIIRPLRNGESQFRGGLIIQTSEGTLIATGYSGGTEDQDTQIAMKGLTTLIHEAEKL